MNREEKNQLIAEFTEVLKNTKVIYLADIEGLDAESTHKLRKACHEKGVKLRVVKNTLLQKAMEKFNGTYEALYPYLKGNTSIMVSDTANTPARIIKEMRKSLPKPVLKAAWIEESVYAGDEQLETLANLKSREELIGDIVLLLQSPAKNVLSALLSSKHTIGGIVKTLQERNN